MLPLTLLASATGARTFTGVAAVSERRPPRLFAAGELIYDKLPNASNRIASRQILGRIAAGALVGSAVASRTGRSRAGFAVLGGLIAFAGAHLTYRMRRALGERLPAVTAALVEDAVVVGAAAIGAALLRSND